MITPNMELYILISLLITLAPSQRQFIQLWKSLYGLYSDDYSNVIEVYSAIGRLGALLTKVIDC